jgi:hypothetical protein
VDPDKVKAIVEMKRPDDISGIRRFLALAELIPKGNRLQQYLPNGVIKVVSGHDSVAKLVCQSDEFAPSLENATAFASVRPAQSSIAAYGQS